MEALIIGLIVSLITGAIAYDFGLEKLVTMALYAEEEISNLGTNGFDILFDIFFGYGVSLIILKFLKKGFETYILWTDGDPDADPIILLANFFRAMAIAISFPIVYDIFAEITEKASTEVMTTIGLNINTSFTAIANNIGTLGFFPAIAVLVFFIIFIFLYIQFITRGLEILILRIGVPLACTGLMDADKGVFRTYIQKFLQSFFTVLIQVVLAKLGLVIMLNGHVFFGIACLLLALRTPRFLQEFLIVSSGGGGMHGIYSSVRLVQMAKMAFKR
ncbi:conjugal transfer protein TrbL family protein [Proteiniborus sp. MB09-C3]|uniref:conjugal transfer protein TrbL family protein n=1 Tax=Proteiniborus sp. MB09-C3 TaxID=3050072 RepID=UPI0025530715|nr:conjugal transfer protein TrbL family protein [Proteiniborus sp. MB09-C3]WIV11160.1 DUF6102 family protein [Proteiniborus sp. MB09-C3]